VGELAQLLDELQGLLALDPGLDGRAEPQGTGEEDEEIETCVEPIEDLVDRTELSPRVDVPGEIPERQEDETDRHGRERPDREEGPACSLSPLLRRDRERGQLFGEPGQVGLRQPEVDVIGKVLCRPDDFVGIQPMSRFRSRSRSRL
jgi:hypothetical protein